MRLMAFTAAFSFLVFAFGACGPRITNQNLAVVNRQRVALEKVGKGLSPKEVESILGQPVRVENFKLPLETQKPLLDGVRYFYEQDGETLELHFVDNKLISDVPELSAVKKEDAISK
ncbi:MAG: hypothetical protein ABIZ56_13425 [Chthoniobacteraceae bacterium]